MTVKAMITKSVTTQSNIDFPFHIDLRGRTAQIAGDAHIRNLIEQFLFTNTGERLNRPDFGSGLLQLIFAPNSPELSATLQFTVQAGLQRWLGDIIEVQALEISSDEAALQVNLQYLVRKTGEIRLETFARSAP